MQKKLTANNYRHSVLFVHQEFVDILNKIIIAYQLTITSDISLPNNENLIRDHFYKTYLKQQWFKRKYQLDGRYRFDIETTENIGRVDIRVLSAKSAFTNDEAYYNIECKRLENKNLKGGEGLNYKYVNEGILRFTTDYYTSYYSTCAMIGFVVDEMDIDENINVIDVLLSQHTSTVVGFSKVVLNDKFDYSYHTKHSTTTQGITMFHLMFNLSSIINRNK